LIVQRAKRPHKCLAIRTADSRERFGLVDANGNEHEIDASRIPSTVRDGKGHHPLKLKSGDRLVLVEFLATEEDEAEQAGDGPPEAGTPDPKPAAEASVPASPPEPETPPPAAEVAADSGNDETPKDGTAVGMDDNGQGLLLDLVPPKTENQ